MRLPFLKQKKDKFDFDLVRTCRTCRNQFRGRYCNVCGEKVLEPNEYTFLNFFDGLLSAFTPLEGKFLNSLGLMIRLPGQLSRNIADGVRVPYMKMISFFFLANFFYFLLPTWDSFNSTLYTHMNVLPHQEQAREMVKEHIEKKQIPLSEFEKKFNEKSTDLSKLLLIMLPVAFCFVLYLTNFSIRLKFVDGKPKLNISFRPKFFEHMLLSLELYSFHIMVNLIIVSGIFLSVVWLAAKAGLDWKFIVMDNNFYVVVIALIAYFLSVSQYTFYKQKWYWIIPKVFILMYFFREVISLYRHFLFYITMWTL